MYDIVYIGAGLNYAGAVVAAKNGKKVALIENDMNQLGGVCLHKGCIPSKMLIHPSNVLEQVKNLEKFNIKHTIRYRNVVERFDKRRILPDFGKNIQIRQGGFTLKTDINDPFIFNF